MIHGKNLIIKVNGTAIAGARSCDINISGEEIEAASVTQSKWREFITGREEWSMTCNHLLPASGTPLRSSVDMVNTTVTIRMESGRYGDVLTGKAIVKSWRTTGTLGNLAQGTFSFRGSGPLS
jgi:predicted secreted protein